MKITKFLIGILVILLMFSSLTACKYEMTKVEYPIINGRYYQTGRYNDEWVEISYIDKNNIEHTMSDYLDNVEISNENKVIVINEGTFWATRTFTITQKYYNELVGMSPLSEPVAVHVRTVSVPESTTAVKTESTSETTTEPESEYTFYDVPFDVDTQKQIADICSEYGLEYELILGVISVESSFKSDTIGDGGKSFGLMQIQPKWWGDLMAQEGITDILDPLQNIRCGCAILNELQTKYGSEYRALQSYNTGNADSKNGYAEKVYRHIDKLVVLEV